MYRKLQLLLSLREDRPAGVLESRLAEEARQAARRISGGGSHRLAWALPEDPTKQTTHASEMAGAPPSFDAVVDVGGEEADLDELVSAVEGIGRRLEGWLVPERSAAVAGTEHVILPGEPSLALIYPLRRLGSLTPEQFWDHWLHVHAEFGRRVPGLAGYRQLHADPDASEAAAKAAGVGLADFDGTAEAYYPSIEGFLAIMSKPEVAAEALEDERRFIDHSRSVMGLYQVAPGDA